jgi:SNF2 family DNA or RNA helicase
MLGASRRQRATAKHEDKEAAREARAEAEVAGADLQVDTQWHSHVTIPPETVSGKMRVAMRIVEKCLTAGDKVIFFSQSLDVLDFMQSWLSQVHGLQPGFDFYRLQGGVSAKVRQEMCMSFNDALSRPKVFLVSVQVRVVCRCGSVSPLMCQLLTVIDILLLVRQAQLA